MATGEVMRLTVFSRPTSEAEPIMLNVYHYLQVSGSLGVAQLAEQWIEDVLPLIVVIQSIGIDNYQIEGINYNDPADFTTTPIVTGGQGTQTGDMLPFYNAYAFIYRRASRQSRNGWKRITGIPESAQAAGILNSGFVTAVNAVGLALENTLTDGAGNSWVPKIARKPVDPFTTPSVFPVQQVSFVGLSTQNTRKFNRGM